MNEEKKTDLPEQEAKTARDRLRRKRDKGSGSRSGA